MAVFPSNSLPHFSILCYFVPQSICSSLGFDHHVSTGIISTTRIEDILRCNIAQPGRSMVDGSIGLYCLQYIFVRCNYQPYFVRGVQQSTPVSNGRFARKGGLDLASSTGTPSARTSARDCLKSDVICDFSRAKYTQGFREKSQRMSMQYALPARLRTPLDQHGLTNARCSLLAGRVAVSRGNGHRRPLASEHSWRDFSSPSTPTPIAIIVSRRSTSFIVVRLMKPNDMDGTIEGHEVGGEHSTLID